MGAPGLTVDARRLVPEVVEAFRSNGLINFAAAISFLVVLANVPFLLFLLALLGFLDLGEVWRDDVAPEIRDSVSPAAFRLLDDTATRVLTEKQGWWVTAGFALALWEISAAMRVTMTHRRHNRHAHRQPEPHRAGAEPVDAVERGKSSRNPRRRMLSFLGRWLVAAALLGAGVALVVQHGSATRQTLPWVSFGTALVMLAWVGMSILFGFYVTYVASYASVFGHLATFFVLLLYVYASSIAFLVGVQADACIRKRAA